MIIQTKNITGAALDWAVAYATNGKRCFFEAFGVRILGRSITEEVSNGVIKPSTDWSQCGALIEQYEIEIGVVDGFGWLANVRYREEHSHYHCTSPLIAACRAIVAAELGNSVDVPDELV